MGSRFPTLRLIFRTTSTSCGTGCLQGASFLRRFGGSTFRRTMDGLGRWEFLRSATESPRRSSNGIWSSDWNRFSTRILTDTDPGGRRSMPSGRLVSDAGGTTGCSISTSRAISTASIGRCCSRRSANIRTALGCFSTSIRWLKAPVQMEDGSIVPRAAGTPQGGVVSPILANLFLHYAFDLWMGRNFPDIPFERYADDVICHCRSAEQARALWSALEARFTACRLALHPQKTKLVYCKDANRRGDFPVHSFDFLGYSFRPRKAMWRDSQYGVSFLPAASPKALKGIRQTIRRWAFHHRPDKSLEDLARIFNPYIQGWINYYSHFYRSALSWTLRRIDAFLLRWARNKFKRLRPRPKGARDWLARVVRADPNLFAHWCFLHVHSRTSGAV